MTPIDRLKNYLGRFGKVEYYPPSFDNGIFNYATISLITIEKIADGLEAEVNKSLSAQNGSRAFIRFISYATEHNDRLLYMVEIVPNADVGPDERLQATEEFIRHLPRVIKNFIQKNPPSKK